VPNWQPNWQDVRWDWAAADRAASELERAAEELDRTSTARGQAAERATADWRGAYRAQFDAHLSATLGMAWHLAGEFRDAAGRIRQASLRASDEQASRVRARDRWRQEKAAEDAAAARARRERAATTPHP
jgi:hypothetical protein